MEYNEKPITNEDNSKLITKTLTLSELAIYLRLRFKDLNEAGYAAGISDTRVRQILIGYRLPKTSKMINQIASGWSIDAVKLTLLFKSANEERKNE